MDVGFWICVANIDIYIHIYIFDLQKQIIVLNVVKDHNGIMYNLFSSAHYSEHACSSNQNCVFANFEAGTRFLQFMFYLASHIYIYIF